MNTTINFGGFYHTHHEYIIEQAVGYMLGIDDPETGEIDSEALYDFNDWPSVMNDYAKQWLDMLNADLGTSLSFMELNSPQHSRTKHQHHPAPWRYGHRVEYLRLQFLFHSKQYR